MVFFFRVPEVGYCCRELSFLKSRAEAGAVVLLPVPVAAPVTKFGEFCWAASPMPIVCLTCRDDMEAISCFEGV